MARIAMWSKLREYRKAANMTQQQVADVLGISLGAYNHYESEGSTRIPQYEILAKLIKLYHIEDESLLNPDTPVVKTVVCNEDILGALRDQIQSAKRLQSSDISSMDYAGLREQVDALGKAIKDAVDDRSKFIEVPDGILFDDLSDNNVILRVNLDKRVEAAISCGMDVYSQLIELLTRQT